MGNDRKRAYRVSFINGGKIYEVYAREVSHGALFGFLEVEGLLFGERTQLVVDPAEESLQREFQGVERTFIPLHSVVRVDEVEKRGTATIRALDRSEGEAPGRPVYTPPPRSGE